MLDPFLLVVLWTSLLSAILYFLIGAFRFLMLALLALVLHWTL